MFRNDEDVDKWVSGEWECQREGFMSKAMQEKKCMPCLGNEEGFSGV